MTSNLGTLGLAVVALVMCVGQSITDPHAPLDEAREADCAVCAIAEPGFDLEADMVITVLFGYHSFYRSATYSLFLYARPSEHSWSRAPPDF